MGRNSRAGRNSPAGSNSRAGRNSPSGQEFAGGQEFAMPRSAIREILFDSNSQVRIQQVGGCDLTAAVRAWGRIAEGPRSVGAPHQGTATPPWQLGPPAADSYYYFDAVAQHQNNNSDPARVPATPLWQPGLPAADLKGDPQWLSFSNQPNFGLFVRILYLWIFFTFSELELYSKTNTFMKQT